MTTTLPLLTISRLRDLLIALQRETPGVLSATLASADGLTVASTLSVSHDADRLAAMSGSLAGLATALTHETGHGTPERLILESAQGFIVTLQVPLLDGGGLVLTVITSTQAVLGKLLWSCRQAVEQLALEASSATVQPAQPA